jgi:hypothetical protein
MPDLDGSLSRQDKSERRPELRAEHLLLRRYLSDSGVWTRGHEPIEVAVDASELRMLAAAQRWLRRVYAKLEITIETNPSSNLVVGDYRELREHPAFRLRPLPGNESPDEHRMFVSINTDDPITFATGLADEYAHLYFALLGNGVSSDAALAWLDGVRQNGWASRFTLPASRDAVILGEISRPVGQLGS